MMHPTIEAIHNWRMKVIMPDPKLARLRRNLIKRGIRFRVPTGGTAKGRMRLALEDAAGQHAVPCASTFGMLSNLTDLEFRSITGRDRKPSDAAFGDHNEFVKEPKLLRLLDCGGRR